MAKDSSMSDDSSNNRADSAGGSDANQEGEPPHQVAEDTDSERHRKNDRAAKRFKSRLLKVLSRWGPYERWKQYRDFSKELSSRLERDAKENESGRMPPNERVEVPALWVAELYTSSTIEGLTQGITNLNWEQGRTRDESVIDWMTEVRHGRTAGWTNLGLVSSVDSPHFMSERTAVLPTGVAALRPTLRSVTPSVSALTVAFMFDDETAQLLDEGLRADYTTFSTRSPRFRRRYLFAHILWGRPTTHSRSVHTPDTQRRDEAAKSLKALEASCTSWLSRNLPGVFASGLRDGSYPTAMLFLSEGTRPFTDESQQIRALRSIGLSRDYNAWETDEWPAVRMVFPSGSREQDLRLSFGARREDSFPEHPGTPDSESNWSISQSADDLIPGLLTRWALSCLLDGYHQMLSQHRDMSASLSTFRPVRDLRDLRTFARTDLYDILSMTTEVTALAKSHRNFAYDVLEMNRVEDGTRAKLPLLKGMRKAQSRRGRQVTREAILLRKTLSMSAETTQTISNVRSQRLILALSALSIIIATSAIVIAVMQQEIPSP